MKILHQVTVKQILTETSKEKLMQQFTRQKDQLQRECDQLYFQLKKVKANHLLTSQYRKEIERRKEKIKTTEFQIEQLHILPLGSELKEKELNGIIDINIGDNWEELMKEKTIVIKDGIVLEIR
ncbi:YlqD family protein [Bacillus sp. FJAT-47783]|uniref:YlqD family protein n=1 Tax=Bacillus sp. FJAT-47783 TaxID=2922712 RepID=UPI001FAE149D|nr:YlqD family protein [Bacillus sp. FJAT-47783]